MVERGPWRRIGAIAGFVEAAGFAAVTLATALAAPASKGWTGSTSRTSVAVSEIVLYTLFTAGCAWVTLGFTRARARAWTPFLLLQGFVAVSAWPLVQSDQLGYRIGGVCGLGAAALGIVSAIRTYSR